MLTDYRDALEAAGAKILNYKTFGSDSGRGDWFAQVLWQGKTAWVHGTYGSCACSDAFLAEFRYNDTECDDHAESGATEEEVARCPACQKRKARFMKRLHAFGLRYLSDSSLLTEEEAEKLVCKNLTQNLDVSQKMFVWLRANTLSLSD
jgi:hypothetical protein